MKLKLRQKVGLVILILFAGFVLLSELSVPKEKLNNWENPLYWSKYPKKANPIWFSMLDKETPTVVLSLSEVTEIGDDYWLFTYVYTHTYPRPPNDIVFRRIEPAYYIIEITRPDGIKIRVYDDELKEDVNLNTDPKMAMQIFSAMRSKLNLNEEDKAMVYPIEILFAKDPDFTVLNGPYTIEVLCSCRRPPQIIVQGNAYGILGTDNYGRDIWVGFVKSMRNTLYLALITSTIIVLLGLLIGSLSGYFDNRLSKIITFMLEVLTSLPILPILVVITWVMSTQGFGERINVPPLKFMLILAFLLMGKFAKTIRMITIKEKAKEYITAEVAIGASGFYILRRHIGPIILEHALRHFTFLMPRIVALISLFGFFGMIPGTNWGSFMIEAMEQGALYGSKWWWILSPGVAMAFLSLGFTLLSLGPSYEEEGMEIWLT
ncbi:ABC transporter permease [Thermococcus argininiproducens]|uniref:ABC transporter permease n=1 Tax=Thermococcus argininiproducens TaxID=2866384 RepID=A0A9E7M9Q9_9EURY|nr:ABC transporter permease [Thermococcus argininiproducens]USG99524.1 ABC transporter permease [Thermococcus argininiproducens]